MPFWCVLNSWLVVQKLSTHQFPEIILFLTFLFLSQIRQKSLSLSKTIHSVLHKLFHKYYVVFWSICERANSAFLILRNGARGELFWEPAGICLGWSILCDVGLVWLVYGRVAALSGRSCVCGWFGGRSERCEKRVFEEVIYYIYKMF